MAAMPMTGMARSGAARGLILTGGIVAGLVGLGWVGLSVKPAPFAAVPQPSTVSETVPLPAGLPAPVERYYRQLYGDRIPVFKTVVISGRATMRPFGPVALPARLRFTHVIGQSYRHYFEATIFGVPVMKVNEHYVDGKGRLDMPWGVEEGAQIDQASNLTMWAELTALPAVFLTDPRVRWEAVDDETALLVVPFGEAEQRFVVRFDPATGRPWLLESMRFKGSSDTSKTLWLNEGSGWTTLRGQTLAADGSVTWGDDGKPWLRMTIEDLAYNVDVDTSLAARGP